MLGLGEEMRAWGARARRQRDKAMARTGDFEFLLFLVGKCAVFYFSENVFTLKVSIQIHCIINK